MQEWPLRISIFKQPRYIPLRFRFMILSSCLLVLLVGVIAILVGAQQARNIRIQVERRGLAIANSIAAITKASLATYNYIALEQTVSQGMQDPETLYLVVHDKEGRVAAFSGRPDLQGRILEDPVSLAAVEAFSPLIQTELTGVTEVRGVDVAVPVYIPGSELRWGTVRVALSLEPMFEQIRAAQIVIVGVGVLALISVIVLAYAMARKITGPLADLTRATMEAATGNLEQSLTVRTRDEVEVLSRNFMTMIHEILLQRRQLESQLAEIRRLQQYTDQLLTTMNDGLLAVDRERRVSTMNPAARSMLDLSEMLPVGQVVGDVLAGLPELAGYVDEMFDKQWAWGQREVVLTGSDEPRTILAGSSFLRDSEGCVQELIVNLHDITELKRLEAHMRQADRLAALGVLAAGMAHEIRNPLSAIKTFVQLLPRKVSTPGFLEKFNRTVPRELDRINLLIGDLLELARKPKYYVESVQLELLVKATLELFEEELLMRGIRVESRFTSGLGPIKADPSELTKAFQNILKNAIQAMPSGGVLSVMIDGLMHLDSNGSRRDSGAWIAVEFRDSGVGMDPETLAGVFNPFFTTKDRGTGLGLAITHKIVTELGGSIEVSSRPGEGTAFILRFPAMRS